MLQIIDYLCIFEGNKDVRMTIESLIQEEILDGSLPPGSKLNIAELKERHQVGLTPLREALSRLSSTGLLRSEPNKGYYVAPMTSKELEELYETSAHLECLALTQSMRNGGEEWESEIVAAHYQLEKLEKAKPSFDVWREADRRFHNALIGCCSQTVLELREIVHLKLTRYVRIAYARIENDFGNFAKEHKALVNATLNKDEKKAHSLINQHVKRGCSILLASYE